MQDDLEIVIGCVHCRYVRRYDLTLPVLDLQHRRKAIRPKSELETTSVLCTTSHVHKTLMRRFESALFQSPYAIPIDQRAVVFTEGTHMVQYRSLAIIASRADQ